MITLKLQQLNKFQYIAPHDTDRLIADIKNLDRTIYNEKVVFGIALYKNDGKLKPSFCKIDFLLKDEILPSEIAYRYDDFVIVRKNITIQFFCEILEKINDGLEVELLPDLRSLIKVNNWEASYVFSNQDWGYLAHQYAGRYYQARFPADVDGFIPNYPLIANDCPPFPNGSLALGYIFNLKYHGWTGMERLFLIEIPDYRAKIKSVKISNKRIIVEAESKFLRLKDLRLQFFISGKGFTITNSNQILTKGKAKIVLEDEAEIILVVLQTKAGEIIDKKEVNLSYVPPDSSIKIEIPSHSLKEMIAMGETKHVEFKSELDNPEPFVSSIISFANSEGGRIFVGVNNHGKIVGISDPPAIKEKIIDWIAQQCDPRIDVDMHYSKDLNIMIVDVPVGKQRPYCMKSGGCFIRHNGTDRQATRSELEQLFKKENLVNRPSYVL